MTAQIDFAYDELQVLRVRTEGMLLEINTRLAALPAATTDPFLAYERVLDNVDASEMVAVIDHALVRCAMERDTDTLRAGLLSAALDIRQFKPRVADALVAAEKAFTSTLDGTPPPETDKDTSTPIEADDVGPLLSLYMAGYTRRQIGEMLNLTPRQVKYRVERLRSSGCL